MSKRKLALTSATLKGFDKPYYYWDHHCYYCWDIRFEDPGTFGLDNLCWIKMGNTKKEAAKYFKGLKERLSSQGLYEGCKLDVIFDERICRAVAFSLKDSNKWISVDDKYVPKTLEELNINLEKLPVY